mgnify:CR=1 FL=1
MSTQEAALQPLLQATDLKKYYPVKKGLFAPERLVKALDGVSFTLERGKTLAVVGESGCGKSTLGRLLTMIETPTGGALSYIDGMGVANFVALAEKLSQTYGPHFKPTPLLQDMAAKGDTFYGRFDPYGAAAKAA